MNIVISTERKRPWATVFQVGDKVVKRKKVLWWYRYWVSGKISHCFAKHHDKELNRQSLKHGPTEGFTETDQPKVVLNARKCVDAFLNRGKDFLYDFELGILWLNGFHFEAMAPVQSGDNRLFVRFKWAKREFHTEVKVGDV